MYCSDLTDAELRTTMSTTVDARLKSKFAVYLPDSRCRHRTIKIVAHNKHLSLSRVARRMKKNRVVTAARQSANFCGRNFALIK